MNMAPIPNARNHQYVRRERGEGDAKNLEMLIHMSPIPQTASIKGLTHPGTVSFVKSRKPSAIKLAPKPRHMTVPNKGSPSFTQKYAPTITQSAPANRQVKALR